MGVLWETGVENTEENTGIDIGKTTKTPTRDTNVERVKRTNGTKVSFTKALPHAPFNHQP